MHVGPAVRPFPSTFRVGATMRHTTGLLSRALLGALLLAACDDSPNGPRGLASSEVWLVDQSNSPGRAYGGTIHIFAGADLVRENAASAAATHRIDLSTGTAELCMSSTGANPVRPHMLFFNSTQSHAVLSFVASGHVVVFDAATRAPIACVRSSPGAGGARQAHAAVPAPDDSYILVANQNGKLLERIDTDFARNSFVLNPAATIDLASCTTPAGQPCESPQLRPDNAPICPIVGSNRRNAFVTLRGGGLFVVDPTPTPMRITAEYDRGTVHPNGCGGVEAGGRVFLNSGGGTGSNLHEFDVYTFPLSGYSAGNPANTPAPTVAFSDDVEPRDSHGMALVGGNVWVFDRGANLVEIFAANGGARRGTIALAGNLSADPTPDLAAVSPGRSHVFVSLRGPNPLSGDPHVSTGSTPGIGVIEIGEDGRTGALRAIVPISNRDGGGVERADPHGIALRGR